MHVAFTLEIEGIAAVFVERLARFVLDTRDGLALAVAVIVELVAVAVDPDVTIGSLLLDGHVGAVAEPAQGHVISRRLVCLTPDHMELVSIRPGDLYVVELTLRIHVKALHNSVPYKLYALAVNDLFGQPCRHFLEDDIIGYRYRCPGIYPVGGCYRYRCVTGPDSGNDALCVDTDRIFIARAPNDAQRIGRLVVPVGL